jgi:hypothetical protein
MKQAHIVRVRPSWALSCSGTLTPRTKNGFVGKTISIGVLATLAAIAIGLAGISAAAAQALYTVTDLGEVPGATTQDASRFN